MGSIKQTLQHLLKTADVKINGSRPWDIQVHNPRLYRRVLKQGSLGIGEAYMDKWWDAEALDEFFTKVLRAQLQRKVRRTPHFVWAYLKNLFVNAQNSSKAYEIGEHHYDMGNDLYKAMLDKRMAYTTGLWENAKTLNEAQEKKLDDVCQKLNLQAGQRVLDIGCGWGSFAKYAAETYDVQVTGITVSKEQAHLAREQCKGLPVEIYLMDYRDLHDSFDHIVSLGMFEHVGYKNYRTFMKVAARSLKPKGTFVLHTIGSNISVHDTDPWIGKYIFPNSMVPSVRQIGRAIEDIFVMEDWNNYGLDYDKTLMAWYQNFNDHWHTLKANYSQRFYRMWKYYLLCSAGSFRSRKNQLWQVVLSRQGQVKIKGQAYKANQPERQEK